MAIQTRTKMTLPGTREKERGREALGVFGRADHLRAATARGGYRGRRYPPLVGCERGDAQLLGEQSVEDRGRRSNAGRADVVERRQKLALKAAKRRELVAWIRGRYGTSVRRAWELAQFSRACWCCKSRTVAQTALRNRIWEVAEARLRFGLQWIHVMLRRERWCVYCKRVRR